MKTILSLCDYSGEWPRPYAEHGYRVVQIDIKHGDDVLNFSRVVEKAGPDVHGILAAPPCTDFTVSGAQYWPAKDADGRTAQSLAIVQACLALVEYYKPKWWALENPVGRLPKLLPELGKPRIYVDPWMFAGFADDPERDRYTKKTGLWGEFNADLPRAPLEPIRACKQGSWIQKLGGKSERTKELRSMTPQGLSRAFFKANP